LQTPIIQIRIIHHSFAHSISLTIYFNIKAFNTHYNIVHLQTVSNYLHYKYLAMQIILACYCVFRCCQCSVFKSLTRLCRKFYNPSLAQIQTNVFLLESLMFIYSKNRFALGCFNTWARYSVDILKMRYVPYYTVLCKKLRVARSRDRLQIKVYRKRTAFMESLG